LNNVNGQKNIAYEIKYGITNMRLAL